MSISAKREIEAIEAILAKANILLREFEDREKNLQQHNATMQSFIAGLEDMKSKLIMMIQSYENDNLLSKLLVLNDSIDEVVTRLIADPRMQTESSVINNDSNMPSNLEYDPFSLGEKQNHPGSSDLIDPDDLLDEIALDIDLEREMDNKLLHSSDGASSSSATKKKRKDKGKGKEKREDKKGKSSICKVVCKICSEEYDNWSKLHELSTCKHIYCIECLQLYYGQRIKDGAVLSIPCPDPACREEVTPYDVKSVLDQETWERYDHFVLISALKQDPNICWCPFPGCTNAIFREPTDDVKIVCDACRYQFCAICKEAWHGDMSCEDFAQIKDKMEKSVAKQAPSFSTWTNKHSKQVKPCPGCKAFIEKVDGCNHMTCVSCKFQFCWMCLSEYTGVHFNDNVNFPNCYMRQYYTPRPWYKPNVEKDTLVKAGKIIGLGAAVMILGVPVAVIGGPIYGCIKLRQKLRPKKWVLTRHGWELHNV